MTGDDYAVFKDGEKWGFRTPDGAVAIPPTFDGAGSFSEGLARVRQDWLWGFIDTTGTIIIEPRFEQARHFTNGHAKVKEAGRWGLIDRSGNWAEDVEAKTYLDDRGSFISEKDHNAWEKPPGKDDDREGE